MNLLKKIWKIIVSRNTAITLLLIMTFVLMIGALLPNPDLISSSEAQALKESRPWLYWLGKNFNSMVISRQPLFAVFSIFLVVSTTACSIDRLLLKRRMKKTAPSLDMAAYTAKMDSFTIKKERSIEETAEATERWLSENRWKIKKNIASDRAVISAEKGNAGFWGSIIFHAILITAIAGWMVYYLWGLSASMVISEGQRINLSREELKRVEKLPVLSFTLPDIGFELMRFYSVYFDADRPVEHNASFMIYDKTKNKTWEQDIKVNKPFSYGGVDFILNLYGFSPYIIFREGENVIFDSYVILDIGALKEDSFDIPDKGIKIRTTIYPDFFKEGDKAGTKTPLPRNPVLKLDAVKDKKLLYSGLLPLGEEIDLGRYKLKFADIKYWIGLRVVREIGVGFFFFAVLLGSAGLLIRFLFPSKNFLVFVDCSQKSKIIVSSYMTSSQFQGLADEERKMLFLKLRERLETD